MRLPAGVFPRGSVFWCRVVIPKDLRHLYPRTSSGALATTHSCVSLQTSDRDEARVRGLARRAEVEGEFLAKRKSLTAPQATVTPELVDELARRIQRTVMLADDARRLSGNPMVDYPLKVVGLVPAAGRLERLDQLQEVEKVYVSAIGRVVAAGSVGFGRSHADVEARKLGISIDWTGQDAALLKLSRVAAQAYADAAKRSEGIMVDTPPEPEPLKDFKVLSGTPVYLRDMLADWKAKRHPKPDAIKRTERALLLFKESGLDKPLGKLTRPDGARLRDWLRAPEREFKQKTALNYWAALLSLLNVAHEYGQIASNPWTRLEFEVVGSKEREDFTAEQLTTLFGSSLYTAGTYRLIYKVQPWDAYFMMLLGLWTGSRIGELAQLELADVLTENGIPLLSIHEEAEGSKVKTEESTRKVPIAPEVVRVGFLDYVDDLRRAGGKKLFPSLHRGGKVTPGDVMGEWVRGYRKDLKLPDGPLHGFHKFRHTVRSALTAHQINPETCDALTGHASKGSTGSKVYTHVRPATVLKALQLPLYPFLDLPRVYPTRP